MSVHPVHQQNSCVPPPHLVESVVVDGDVVQLSALLYILEVRLRGGEGELVAVHVGDVPQDVVAASLCDHLSRNRP